MVIWEFLAHIITGPNWARSKILIYLPAFKTLKHSWRPKVKEASICSIESYEELKQNSFWLDV